MAQANTKGYTSTLNSQYIPAKISQILNQKLAQINDNTLLQVEILTLDSYSLRQWCINHDIDIIGTFPIGRYTCVTCQLTKIDFLLLNEELSIVAAEVIRTPYTELKQEGLDLSLNEISLLHIERKDLAGNNHVLSLKENSFDTTDIDFRGRYFLTDVSSTRTQLHATSMASIAAGGGNSDPTSTGVVWDATITSASFDTLLPNADSYFETNDIHVQNHSYGTGIENYYGIETMAYDEACNRIPSLVHIFSSGNDGTESSTDGTYTGISGKANLTGQFKHSKNTMTVGATDSLDNVVSLSSRGPAYDGRIKPEVVAYGHGGTSGSAAILSGLCILMQEEYKLQNGDDLPPASLIKAIIANTAKDIGRPGPDFESGFGSIRGYEAIKAIDKNQFAIGQVKQGETFVVPVSVSPGSSQVKISLAWTDPAAIVEAPKALINDLDLEWREVATGQAWQPWILNSTPNVDSLELRANRGKDTLNNIEQITLANPGPGEYEIIVHGKTISVGSQDFSVTWLIEEINSFQWVFPTALDYLKPNEQNILRWNSGGSVNGKIEYKQVGTENWIPVSGELDPLIGFYKWHVDAESGLIQLRWINSDTIYLSDTFVVGNQVKPKVALVCPDSLLFHWSPAIHADSFEILALGERHLEHIGYTQDTFYIEYNPEQHGYHYAVAPIYQNTTGPRSYGFDYRTQGAGCYINQFFLRYIEHGTAYFEADLGTLYNVNSVILAKLDGDIYTHEQTISPVTDTKLFFDTDQLDQGVNYFHIVVVLNDGTGHASEEVVVYYHNQHDLLIFPNPAFFGYDMQILVKRDMGFTLQILDVLGREVIYVPSTTNPMAINVSGLVVGQYIAVVRYEDGVVEVEPFVLRN